MRSGTMAAIGLLEAQRAARHVDAVAHRVGAEKARFLLGAEGLGTSLLGRARPCAAAPVGVGAGRQRPWRP
jgi:hypothetical protein